MSEPEGLVKHHTLAALIASVTGSLASVLPVFLTAALAPPMAVTMQASPERVVAAGSTLFLWSAVLSIPGGRLVDRLGWRASLRISILLSATSLALVATASSTATLCAVVAIGGVANALALPSGNALLMAHVHPARRGLAYGLRQSAIPVASVFGGITLTLAGDNWRPPFIALAGMALAMLFLLPWKTLDSRRRARRVSSTQSQPGGSLLMVSLGAGLGSASATAAATFIVASAIAGGLDHVAAGVLLAGSSAVGITVRVLSGAYVDRYGGGVAAVGLLMLLGALGMAGLAASYDPAVILGSLLALGAGWGWQGILQHTIALAHLDTIGRASGIVQAGLAAGAAGGPMCFALLVSTQSYQIAWLSTAVTAAFGAFLLNLFSGRRPAT